MDKGNADDHESITATRNGTFGGKSDDLKDDLREV